MGLSLSFVDPVCDLSLQVGVLHAIFIMVNLNTLHVLIKDALE